MTRIGIDGYEANSPDRVGVGRFALELLRGLYEEISETDEVVVFVPNSTNEDLPPEKKNWHYRQVPHVRLWTFTSLPRALAKEKLDVFFSPTHYVPFFSSIPRVCAIMDLSYLEYPSLFRLKDLIKLKFGTWYSIQKAQKIITISQFSKDAIVKEYGVDADTVTVIYPGFDQNIFNTKITQNDIKVSLDKFEINYDYILYIGTLQPRKNIVRLIESFSLLEDKSIKLLIIGKKGWLYEEIIKKIEESDLKNRIVWIGYVEDRDLGALLAGAQSFVLPSLYEGFGIPVVEALACGVPVVVSQVSSLPEIAGDAGLYIDPESTTSISDGLTRALSLSESEKDIIRQKGLKHIEQFDWKKSCKKLLELLKSI